MPGYPRPGGCSFLSIPHSRRNCTETGCLIEETVCRKSRRLWLIANALSQARRPCPFSAAPLLLPRVPDQPLSFGVADRIPLLFFPSFMVVVCEDAFPFLILFAPGVACLIPVAACSARAFPVDDRPAHFIHCHSPFISRYFVCTYPQFVEHHSSDMYHTWTVPSGLSHLIRFPFTYFLAASFP